MMDTQHNINLKMQFQSKEDYRDCVLNDIFLKILNILNIYIHIKNGKGVFIFYKKYKDLFYFLNVT